MADNPSTTNSSVHARRSYITTTTTPASDLIDTLLEIIQSRLTGSLTINFVSGVPGGTIEFRQKSSTDPLLPADKIKNI